MPTREGHNKSKVCLVRRVCATVQRNYERMRKATPFALRPGAEAGSGGTRKIGVEHERTRQLRICEIGKLQIYFVPAQRSGIAVHQDIAGGGCCWVEGKWKVVFCPRREDGSYTQVVISDVRLTAQK
eukprot:1234026-Pleurochrysis_carterae.AAC.2